MESDTSLGLGVGDVDLSGYALAAYVSYTHGGFYADLMYQFAAFDHDIARNTFFGETARAEPDSQTHTVALNVGYNLETHGVTTGPYAGLQYSNGDIDAYTEHGGGTKNVHVEQQGFDSLVLQLGWQISKTFQIHKVKVTPQVRLGWRHEFLDESDSVRVGLVESPFQIGDGRNFQRVGRFDAASNTRTPNADALELGVGVLLELSDRTRLVLDYEARVFQGDSVQHSVSLMGAVRF
jgi:outer membrane autotransporter protein